MIDNMIRNVNLDKADEITCLHQWFDKCPPQGKLKHWVDGRSAKETAKHWLHTIPQPFKDILQPFKLKYKICSPEYVTKFDGNGGNGRNHDLLILAENEKKDTVIISIESKVDEAFGDTILETINRSIERKKKSPNSKGLKRISELRIALFGKEENSQLDLRYQLLTAVAGTVSEAEYRKSKTAILLIQTFLSDEIDKKKHLQNQSDLDAFISLFSKSKYTKILDNQLIGPLRIVSKTNHLPDDIDLWIGKYSITI